MTVADMKKLLVFDLSGRIRNGADHNRIREAAREAGRIKGVLKKHGITYIESREYVRNGFRGYAPLHIEVYGNEDDLRTYGTVIAEATGTWYTSRRTTEQ